MSNSVFKDPFYHFHNMSNNLISLRNGLKNWAIPTAGQEVTTYFMR